jgi:hypothetical protein
VLRRVTAATVVVTMGLLGLLQVGGMRVAGASVAGPGTELPCSTIGQMAVDQPTSQVFVSCPSTNSVAVMSFSGSLVATITGIAGATGLADVGSEVYVSAVNTGTIDAINTSTLAVQPTGATGLVDPTDLVYGGGYLWSTTTGGTGGNGCDAQVSNPLYRIDPTTGAVDTYNKVLGTFVDSLIAAPGDPNKIFGTALCDSASPTQVISISAGVPSAGPLVNGFDYVAPLDVSPDGSTVFEQDASELVGLSSTTLEPAGLQYLSTYELTAVATSSGDGGVIAYDGVGLSIYGLGNPADHIGSTQWAENQDVEPQGLAFSPDGMTIFVVTTAPESASYSGPPGPAEFRALATNALPTPPPDIEPPASGDAFAPTTVGTVSGPDTVVLQNQGPGTDLITGVTFSGADPDDFIADPSQCNPNAAGVITLAPSDSCFLDVYFAPGALGSRSATMTLDDNEARPFSLDLSGVGTEGYYEATANGAVLAFGDAVSQGDMSKKSLAAPIISMALTPDGQGYWLLGQDGGIFSFGDADFYGSTGGIHLNKPVVGMTPTPDGSGYWLVASDGGIFSFGDGAFYGSTGGILLNKPVVGMAPTPDGSGYWLVASDGGIFSFGDAAFYGSTGSLHLNKPIVGMAPTPDGGGYWLVASDGGIFAFGDATFYGSTGSLHLNKSVVGMAPTPDGSGYWLVASDGGIFSFGDATFYGSGASNTGQNIVTLVSSGDPTLQATSDLPAVRIERSDSSRW